MSMIEDSSARKTQAEIREGFYRSEDGEWIPDGWKVKPLVELTRNRNISYGVVQPGSHFTGGVPMIRVNNLTNNTKIIADDVVLINPFLSEKHNKTILEIDDILLSLVGTTGLTSIVGKEHVGWNVARAIAVIKPQSKDYTNWLNYYFKTSRAQVFLNDRANTTVQKTINLSDVKKLPILLPSKSESFSIAAVLGSLDDKIELLREQNETLEALAQTLFKRWFIDFNFPDENGNPYKDNGGKMILSESGEMPEGWEEIELGDIVTVKRGGSPRPIKDFITEGEGLRWLKISDASATKSPFIHKIREKIIFEGLRKTTHLNSGKLVLSNSATPGIPKFLAVDSCIHDGWLHFPDIGYLTQDYLYLLFLKIRPELIQQGNGSVFTNLKTDILKQHWIVVPREGQEHIWLLKGFSSIFEKIKINAEQIETLTKLRDTLLPKLMKGEIRVPIES